MEDSKWNGRQRDGMEDKTDARCTVHLSPTLGGVSGVIGSDGSFADRTNSHLVVPMGFLGSFVFDFLDKLGQGLYGVASW
jgi:hypothetical protein